MKIEEAVRQDVLCPDAAPAIRATGQKQRGQVETETVAGQAVPIQTLDRGAIEFAPVLWPELGTLLPGRVQDAAAEEIFVRRPTHLAEGLVQAREETVIRRHGHRPILPAQRSRPIRSRRR